MRSVLATLGLLYTAACPASNEPTIDDPCLPGDPACPRTCDQFRPVGDFELCTATTDTGYSVVARYTGAGTIDVDQTELRVAGDDVPASQGFDAATSTWTLTAHDLAPGKYSVLLRARTTTGDRPRALFAPLWIGQGGYADFGWKDAILYQILTDRFRDGDSRNNLDNGVGDLARVDDPRSRWQGGDFAGITAKPVADTRATVATLFALSMESREAVDTIFAAALANGGREVHGVEDAGFMYSVGFEDPDGHGFGPCYRDLAATPA